MGTLHAHRWRSSACASCLLSGAQEQIRRNRERMKALNLPSLAASVASVPRAAKKETKGPRPPRQPKTPVPPSKRSLRSAGLDPDGQKFAAGLTDDCNWDALVASGGFKSAGGRAEERSTITYGAIC